MISVTSRFARGTVGCCCILNRSRHSMRPGKTTRREFLKSGAAVLPLAARAAAESVGPMKITRVEAVRFRSDKLIQGIAPNWMWVRLHTDTGLVGIGES